MKCVKCNLEKPEIEFSFKYKAKNIRKKNCKSCDAIYKKEYYKNNKEKAIEYSVTSTKKLRIRNRRYVWDYLTNHPCVDCGENNPVTLEFDHNDTGLKIANISIGITNAWSLMKLQTEIDKCQVRCSNCHKIRTAKQFGWYKSFQ